MKKILTILMALSLIILTACSGKSGEQKETTAKKASLKVGIVFAEGGLGDKSFNDSAFRGLEMAKEKHGIEFNYVEPATSAENEQFLRQYAEAKYDLIIATGFAMKEACQKVASEYPELKFVMIDSVIDLPNVSSLIFKEDEGSFIVGALAGMMSKDNKIGFVGALDIPLIRKFLNGYEQGAKYVNPKIEVLNLFVSSSNPFNDPVKGKEAALSLIKQGADIVYHAAGGTGVGVIEAAKETGKFAIGVDSNQDGVAKGFVLTSMIKRVDNAILLTIDSLVDGNFKTGINEFGLKENGVGATEFEFTKDKIPADVLKKLDEIKAKLISGEIKLK